MDRLYDIIGSPELDNLRSDMLDWVDELQRKTELTNRLALAQLEERAENGDLGRVLAEEVAETIAGLLITSPEATERIRVRGEAAMVVANTAIQVERFRTRNGRYPDRLEELVPERLAAPPLDPFTDQPLVYRQEAQGFVLYSVGPNLTDNGGTHRDQVWGTPQRDEYDVVLRVAKQPAD